MTQILQQLDPSNGNGATLALAADGTFALTGGLETLVFQSLFTNARAPKEFATITGEPNGWWADTVDDKIGSLLYLLRREKFTKETIRRAQLYTSDCLQWMLADGIASKVATQAEAYGDDVLAIAVQLFAPNGEKVFDNLWAIHRNNL